MEVGLRRFASLPNEIICEVLKILPVKILLVCRCVCKEWNSIITSQSFINTHLLSQPHRLLFCQYHEKSCLSYSSSSDKIQFCSFFPNTSPSLVHKFEVPLPKSYHECPRWIVVGSLDGLLFLTTPPFGYELHLWNPAIKKCKTLSNSCLFNQNNLQSFFSQKPRFAFGLGFRLHTSDHIIIRIVVFQSRSRRNSKSNRLPEAEVYYLSTESWKKVEISEEVSKRLMNISSRRYVNLNGDLNWMATFSDGDEQLYDSILSFDVNKEEFREISLPSEYNKGIRAIRRWIEVYRGSLAVVVAGKIIPDDGSTHVWLWVMEEYGNVDSWRRIRVNQMGPRSLHGCFILDGKIMFKLRGWKGRRRVKLLDMETLQERQFWVPDFQSVHAFKETLSFLPTQ